MAWRKQFRTGLLVLALVLALAVPCFADISYGVRIQGENSFTQWTSTTATLHGTTRVGVPFGTPNKIDCQLQLFKNGTLVSTRSWPMVNVAMTGGDLDGTTTLSGSWQGYGWHYAYWAEELFTDTCTTYPTPGSGLLAAAENTPLVTFAKDDESLKDGQMIGFYQSSEKLKEALGQKKGVQLDVLLHQGLSEYLRIGDTIPGIVLSPNGDKATALFFHVDGSTTRVDIAYKDSVWAVEQVKDITK